MSTSALRLGLANSILNCVSLCSAHAGSCISLGLCSQVGTPGEHGVLATNRRLSVISGCADQCTRELSKYSVFLLPTLHPALERLPLFRLVICLSRRYSAASSKKESRPLTAGRPTPSTVTTGVPVTCTGDSPACGLFRASQVLPTGCQPSPILRQLKTSQALPPVPWGSQLFLVENHVFRSKL